MQILHAFSCMINCSRIVTICMHIFMPEACMHSSCMHENACKCANLLACRMHASCMHCMHVACMPACMIHACSAGMHSLEGRSVLTTFSRLQNYKFLKSFPNNLFFFNIVRRNLILVICGIKEMKALMINTYGCKVIGRKQ